MNFKPFEDRFKDILARAGIPSKKITLTRSTIIVELHGEKHAKRVAQYIKGAGYTRVKIFDNRPSLFHSENNPNWRVSGITKELDQFLQKQKKESSNEKE